MKNYNRNRHIARHKLLHAALNELIIDWINIRANQNKNFFIKHESLEEFAKWSLQQTKEPEIARNSLGEDYASKLAHLHTKDKKKMAKLNVFRGFFPKDT